MYQLTNSNTVLRLIDGANIPTDCLDNCDFVNYLSWLAEGNEPLPTPQPTPEEVTAKIVSAIQALLDSTAQAHGYDHIRSVISYENSKVLKWKTEAYRAKEWRDDCWLKAQEIQTAVLAGAPVPTVGEVLAQMPPADWPAL